MDEEGNDEQGIVLLNSLMTQYPLIKLSRRELVGNQRDEVHQGVRIASGSEWEPFENFCSSLINLGKSVVFCGFLLCLKSLAKPQDRSICWYIFDLQIT